MTLTLLPPVCSDVGELGRLVLRRRVGHGADEGEARHAGPSPGSGPDADPSLRPQGQEQRAGGTTQEAEELPAAPSSSSASAGRPQERLRSAHIRFVGALRIRELEQVDGISEISENYYQKKT